MAAHDTSRNISEDVLTILSAGRCDGRNFHLPAQQLDRRLYECTNAVLEALGGKWHRKERAHVFDEPCEHLINDAIETRSYIKPGDMGWFPTPQDIAGRAASLADIRPGMAVLEPSAGEGALVLEAIKLGGKVTAIEVDKRRAETLSTIAEVNVIEGDFLSVDLAMQYDRVLMNPPFAGRADIHHVTHAMSMLKPGGRLVAIMPASVLFREDALTRNFRAVVESAGGHFEPLPEGAFKVSGTNVRTAIVAINSPAIGAAA